MSSTTLNCTRGDDAVATNPGNGPIPRAERWVACVLLLAAFALRCFYIFRFRYDSDEPQHLHTTWGWTQGLLQYRDFFDNHTPVFHILFSPLVALLGERANILTWMRFAMVPLWLVCLGAVWWIGTSLFSRRAGLWATVFISLLPWWFFCALEYRTDNLWTPLWLVALAVLVTGRMSGWRAFGGGLILGLCCCTSMKTSVLLVVSAMAAVVAPQLAARRLDVRLLGRCVRAVIPLCAGLLIAPGAVVSYFAAHGAWPQFLYCVIQHNILPGVDAKAHPWYYRLMFPAALPFLLYGAFKVVRHSPGQWFAIRRSWLFLVAGLYYAALYSFWALLTRQDYLPFFPLAAILGAPLVIRWVESFHQRSGILADPGSRRTWVLSTVGLLEIGLLLGGRPPWIDGTWREREVLRETLQLTKPGEIVMDFKGELVFRPRAFYYVLEPLVAARIKRGIIKDNIFQRLVETKTRVILNQDWFYSGRTSQSLAENYLSVGQVRVAGRVIAQSETAKGAAVHFSVEVPTSYVIWADGAPVRGLLDGQPYDSTQGGKELSSGTHEFQSDEPHPRLAIVWDRAVKAGYIPVLDRTDWQLVR